MADRALKNALARRAELLKEINEIDVWIAGHNRFSSLSDANSVSTQPSAPKAAPGREVLATFPPESPVGEENANQGRTLRLAEWEPIIRETLREAGRPLTRTALLEALTARGYPVSSTYNASKVVGTIVWRLRDKFVNLAGFGYWPVDIPYAPAKYAPPSKPDLDADVMEGIKKLFDE